MAAGSLFLLTAFLYSCKENRSLPFRVPLKIRVSLKLVYLIEADSSQA
jgi:hypothetical protein